MSFTTFVRAVFRRGQLNHTREGRDDMPLPTVSKVALLYGCKFHGWQASDEVASDSGITGIVEQVTSSDICDLCRDLLQVVPDAGSAGVTTYADHVTPMLTAVSAELRDGARAQLVRFFTVELPAALNDIQSVTQSLQAELPISCTQLVLLSDMCKLFDWAGWALLPDVSRYPSSTPARMFVARALCVDAVAFLRLIVDTRLITLGVPSTEPADADASTAQQATPAQQVISVGGAADAGVWNMQALRTSSYFPELRAEVSNGSPVVPMQYAREAARDLHDVLLQFVANTRAVRVDGDVYVMPTDAVFAMHLSPMSMTTVLWALSAVTRDPPYAGNQQAGLPPIVDNTSIRAAATLRRAIRLPPELTEEVTDV